MKNVRFLAIAVAAVVAGSAATTALAADKRISVSAFGQVSKYSGSDATGTIFLSVGYLFTDRLEGEVRLSQTLGGPGEFTLLGVGGKYYFGGVAQAKTWLPYAHASYSKSLGSGLDFNLLRGGAGVDLPINEAASVSVEGAVVRNETTAGAFKTKTNGSEVVVGLKIRF